MKRRKKEELLARFDENMRQEEAELLASQEKDFENNEFKNLEPGLLVPGEGIYIGHYAPNDLGKLFKVFAAPQDLANSAPDNVPQKRKAKGFGRVFKVFSPPQDEVVNPNNKRFTYLEAVSAVAALKGWYGFDGTNYKSDTQLRDALEAGGYGGGWFIPPIKLLWDKDADWHKAIGEKIEKDNLYGRKDEGALKGTFKNSPYWSSTVRRYDYDASILADSFDFSDGQRHPTARYGNCRPVRLVQAVCTIYAGMLTEEGIYIGRFKDKDGVEKKWFAAPGDATDKQGKRLSFDFNEAAAFASKSNTLDHKDWAVPPGCDDPAGEPDILNEMFKLRDQHGFKGTFNETGSLEGGYYGSSSAFVIDNNHASVQRFSDGHQLVDEKSQRCSIRLVRSVAI